MTDPSKASTDARKRVRMTVRGRVQGVGFRPTLYRELTARGCGGSIRNTPEGVVLEVEGAADTINAIVEDFRSLIPPRARVDEIAVAELEPAGETKFRIIASCADGQSLLPIPPDMATCEECARELHAPADRRRAYPFNTCTCCGPRFSIARAVPFDRPTSAMDDFPLCPACAREYADADDRRFHAQTMSCPECGPSLCFAELHGEGAHIGADALDSTRQALAAGRIVAIKGIGGFHLACDATREDVVAELRRRKVRPHKPLAIMAPDLETCRRLFHLPPGAEELLASPPAPIVLLAERPDSSVAANVAPALAQQGVMLAYTPLHRMLFDDPRAPRALVMTSCNRAEEPIAIEDADVERLRDIADCMLTHNRPITNRCDDSVVMVHRTAALPVRRSRGYVPEPIMLARDGPPTLATGAMWKNTFCLTTGRRAFLSQHIGDVSDADNARYFAESFERFSKLLRLEPEVVACDLHPDYPTTAFARALAEERGLTLVQVQHHHAHVAALLAEHGRAGPIIGVSMDGTGYGEDGTVWGGEFMVADLAAYERRCHLEYVPLPGGEQAIIEPARMALSHVARALGPDEALARVGPVLGQDVAQRLLRVMDNARFSPLTSSCGRLFDAVASLVGVRHRTSYEGQAACELEAICAEREDGTYDYEYEHENEQDAGAICVKPIVRGVCADLDAGVAAARIASRFHNTVARMIVETCRRLRQETGLGVVGLSGGVMHNQYLLGRLVPTLEAEGFEVLTHRLVPPGDGGMCLGQAACALARATAD